MDVVDRIWCTRCGIHIVSTGFEKVCPVCADEEIQRMIVETSLALDTHIERGEN